MLTYLLILIGIAFAQGAQSGPASTPKAEFVDFQDVQGDLRTRVPDGKLDYHFRLTGLQKRPIAFIDVKAGSDFKAEGSSAAKVTSSDNSNYDAPKVDIA